MYVMNYLIYTLRPHGILPVLSVPLHASTADSKSQATEVVSQVESLRDVQSKTNRTAKSVSATQKKNVELQASNVMYSEQLIYSKGSTSLPVMVEIH